MVLQVPSGIGKGVLTLVFVPGVFNINVGGVGPGDGGLGFLWIRLGFWVG